MNKTVRCKPFLKPCSIQFRSTFSLNKKPRVVCLYFITFCDKIEAHRKVILYVEICAHIALRYGSILYQNYIK